MTRLKRELKLEVKNRSFKIWARQNENNWLLVLRVNYNNPKYEKIEELPLRASYKTIDGGSYLRYEFFYDKELDEESIVDKIQTIYGFMKR